MVLCIIHCANGPLIVLTHSENNIKRTIYFDFQFYNLISSWLWPSMLVLCFAWITNVFVSIHYSSYLDLRVYWQCFFTSVWILCLNQMPFASGLFLGAWEVCVHAVTQSCPTLENLWTVACQASLSRPLCLGFPVKNTGMCCHFLLQRIFLTQAWNPHLFCLLDWQADSLPLSPLGSP